MSLYKRGETWWISFTAPDGKRIRKSAGTADRNQAQEYHDRLKVRLWEQHKLGVKPERTWQEAVVRWLKETSHKATHQGDISMLRWIDQYLGDLKLNQINRDVIDHFAEIRASTSGVIHTNRHLALIRAILRRARDEWEWIDHIPKVRLYPEPKRRIRFITREEAKELIKHLPEHLADMAGFTLATGLRQRNVSYLRWEQIDLSRQVAWIYPDEAKTRRAIAVPLNKDAMHILHKRLKRHEVYVFTYRGKPVAQCSTKAWKRALKDAGIKNFRWHDLRHTWASWHVQNGTSLQELMELGGWCSFEMVLRYAHLAADHLKDAANRIVEDTNLSQKNQDKIVKLIVSR